STGQPKGVMIQHAALCDLCHTQSDIFQINKSSRVLQFASLSFDASVFEIFIALISGAPLVLGTKETLRIGENLVHLLRTEKISHVTLPPVALEVMKEEEFDDLKVVISAGSACSKELAEAWSKKCTFINAYGPTETTVCATTKVYLEDNVISIGRPIANTRAYILDAQQQLVPIGAEGELYIGGNGLARGYLNMKEKTLERFKILSVKEGHEERLYRTGDAVRYLANGEIEYIGRIDNQVKIRGYRIELGEVEAVLSRHPSIQQASVVAKMFREGDLQLVGYVVGDLSRAE
ncbi:hypothetical protein AMS62_29375, partial [Bacillus sp. FJAT-18019]